MSVIRSLHQEYGHMGSQQVTRSSKLRLSRGIDPCVDPCVKGVRQQASGCSSPGIFIPHLCAAMSQNRAYGQVSRQAPARACAGARQPRPAAAGGLGARGKAPAQRRHLTWRQGRPPCAGCTRLCSSRPSQSLDACFANVHALSCGLRVVVHCHVPLLLPCANISGAQQVACSRHVPLGRHVPLACGQH